MSRLFSDYVRRARRILEANWTGSFTRPSPSLYPHQWNWDSGFIAMGTAHFDTVRAIKEIETLFSAQWKNGMLPHIVFDPKELGHYFPEPDFWQTERSPDAPPKSLTSGLTMPPVHAIAALKIYEAATRKNKAKEFLKGLYPKLIAFHEYLYRERDLNNEGLVYIRHPWESGIDNSPTWDIPLQKIIIDKDHLPEYTRKDLEQGIDASMRPSDDDYDRYVFLVNLFKVADYDESKIRQTCPFLIQDPLFNSVLCRANESLAEIAEILGESPEEPRSWYDKTSNGIRNKLWCEEHGIFDAYDIVSDTLLDVDTAAGFLPLFAGAATRDQAEQLFRRLDSSSFCALHQGNCFTIPNYDTSKKDYDRANYWRGPIWININWMLAHGLRRYGYTLKADSLQKDLLQLPIRFGFHEYFDSFNGTGYGSDNFSWTAALFVDLVNAFYETEKKPLEDRLSDYAKGIVSTEDVLNEGHKVANISPEELASRLMKTIRSLRDNYYDTRRGRVNYESIKESSEFREYRVLTNSLRHFDPASLVGRKEKLAFWINLYNAIVVDGIISLGIKQSVKEVPDFFSRIKYIIGPYAFSPDDIEHGILRGNSRPWFRPLRQFGATDQRRNWVLNPIDPRIHFALVCGSRSCAPIDFYDIGNIYEQLDSASQSFINSSEVLVLPEDKKILISDIFRWYEKDFGGNHGIIDFLYDYMDSSRSRAFIRESSDDLSIEYLHYDWNINR